VTVEESRGLEFETEYVEGMQFDRGYISPYFISNPMRWKQASKNPTCPDLRQENQRRTGHRAPCSKN
jgi:hypothetical protein